MSKISCDVIKDLLPLYKDKVCSDKSKDLIEEHLTECIGCREYLDAMDAELPPVVLSADTAGAGMDTSRGTTSDTTISDIELFKKIANRLNWMKVIICFFALITSVMVISMISELELLKIPGLSRRLSLEDIRITELYQLEDGNLYFTLASDIPFQIPSYSTTLPDAKSDDNVESSVSLKKVSFLETFLLERPTFNKFSFVIPLEMVIYMEEYDGDSMEDTNPDGYGQTAVVYKNTRIYYEGKGNEELTIWKKGQEIDKAPEKVEERVRHEQNIQEQEAGYTDESEESSEYEDWAIYLP